MTEPRPAAQYHAPNPDDARDLVALVCYLAEYADVEPWDVATPEDAALWWARFAVRYNGIALEILEVMVDKSTEADSVYDDIGEEED